MSYPTENGTAATLRSPSSGPDSSPASLTIPEKLERGQRIGKGGMGEVYACTDHQLARTVALKVATTQEAADLERFVREARVQGQLQHPSIVPVHELGATQEGQPFFTMKKVQGVTLQEVIERVGAGDAEAAQRYTRRKLLAAFVSICQAVDFAHQQGVLHRDLKPANVMLGDFGEVYVLDWGLAKRLGVEEPSTRTPPPLELDVLPTGSTPTAAGSLLGTPGYLAPEQVVGGSASVQSDVYALGVVLFELLTFKRAVEAPSVRDALLKTRDGIDVRARVRAPERDVPPELEALCVKACSLEPQQRPASARELIDTVERYLEGERDQQLRHELARQHAARARELAKGVQGDDALEARRQALQEVSRTLALDPDNRDAVEVMLQLLQTRPPTLPKEVRADVEAAEAKRGRSAAASESIGYVVLGLFLPVSFAMGLRVPWAIGLYAASATAAGLLAFLQGRRDRPKARTAALAVLLSAPALALSGYMFGPFVMLPSMAVLHLFTCVLFMPPRAHPIAIVVGVAGLMMPLATWGLGLTPPPLRFTPEGILLVPQVLELPRTWSMVMLVGGNLGFVAFATFAAIMSRRQMGRADEEVALQAWNLRQLLPPEASTAAHGAQPAPPPPSCPAELLRG